MRFATLTAMGLLATVTVLGGIAMMGGLGWHLYMSEVAISLKIAGIGALVWASGSAVIKLLDEIMT